MMYRRSPGRQRRYEYSNPSTFQESANDSVNMGAETIKHLEDIPMPNESEAPYTMSSDERNIKRPGILDILKGHIHMEEIILIGLIVILLLDGGLNGIEDELLLVMLVILLLT